MQKETKLEEILRLTLESLQKQEYSSAYRFQRTTRVMFFRDDISFATAS